MIRHPRAGRSDRPTAPVRQWAIATARNRENVSEIADAYEFRTARGDVDYRSTL